MVSGSTCRLRRSIERALLAAAVIVVPAGSHAVAAADARSTLTVSVTVVRHCVIHADAADSQSTKVRVSCTRHPDSSTQPTSDRQADRVAPPPRNVRVGTEPLTNDTGARIVTVDF
jgi:hypothetical protein